MSINNKVNIPDYVYLLPQMEQNKWLKQWLIDLELVFSVIRYQDLDISIYFPNKTRYLLERFSKEELKFLDKIYLLLIKRNFIIPFRWKLLPDLFVEMGFLPSSVFSMFADDYEMLYIEDKNATTIVDIGDFVRSKLN